MCIDLSEGYCAKMSTNLILTGWGLPEYACAAALAFRHFKDADILGMSTRRLPEFLDGMREQSWRTIIILGIGLTGNPEQLASALKKLKNDGVRVSWISSMPFREEISEKTAAELRKTLEIHINKAGLLEAAGEVFGLPYNDLTPLKQDHPRSTNLRACRILLDAAMYSYRNYQDTESYGAVIRHIANRDTEKAWSSAERKLMEHYQRYGGRELIGKSKTTRSLIERINLVAPHDEARVIIYGESGTGKETVAQLIHNKSPRKGEPFFAFNCASVTPNLLESHFFGHEKGSFTGANERKEGLFTLANGGTLFLDEIGELPLEAQGILLRVLEGGRFTRLGGTEEIETNVRLITATNRDLAAMVRDGKFREDLFFRLNVIKIRIPPLRDHLSDVEQIADTWWFRRCKCHLSKDQIKTLMSYDYPGNVRELNNMLEQALVFGEQNFAEIIEDSRIATSNLRISHESEGTAAFPVVEMKDKKPTSLIDSSTWKDMDNYPDDWESLLRLHVRRMYEKCGHNLTKAAKMIRISRNTAKKYLDS